MTGDLVEVRPCQPADLAAVLELWREARSAHARTPDDVEALTRLLEDGPESLLVAVLDGQTVGTLIAAWDGWRGNMYRLAVAPDRRRAGIGRALVRAGEASLRARGARRITALVAHSDDPAIALWRASGYERDEIIVRFVHNV